MNRRVIVLTIVMTAILTIAAAVNAQEIEYVGSYDTPGGVDGVFISGSYAYVADDYSGLQIINVANPANPTLAGSYDTPDYALGVFVSGSYAYVADWNSGLQIIDISNPANPTLAGSYNTPGYAYGVFVSGSYAYVADHYSGLQIINVADPASPALVGSYDMLSTVDVFVQGDYVYVADDYSLTILHFENPVGIEDSETLPENISLLQNYPNPFNARTEIKYTLPVGSDVKLEIYNLLGQKVVTLADEKQTAGYHSLIWDGTNESGQMVSSGMYLYKLTTNENISVKKMVMLK